MLKRPLLATRLDQSELSTALQNRQVAFRDAYSLSGLEIDLLVYYSNLLSIVSLEYLMGRTSAPGSQVHELETAAFVSGIPYWRVDKEPALGH